MIRMTGDANRLRPHIKTHKTAEIIKMQMAHGIQKFKCATIAEAELLAQCGAQDVLLAMQPVGANIDRFLRLMHEYPNSEFAALTDNLDVVKAISKKADEKDMVVTLYLDLNTGMNRTGIIPGEEAAYLFKIISDDGNLVAKGLHAYDGHIRNEDFEERKKVCDAALESVLELKTKIERIGIPINTIIAGGSPTFPIHCKREGVEASPGTTLLWDERYGSSFADMDFLPAAVLLTRIISKPKAGVICMDLGHKAIAPEMDFPRVKIFGMETYGQIGQSEEHLVIQCPENHDHKMGDVHYAIPMHVCPTVAKYPELLAVENGEVIASWKVAARDYRINI